MGDQVATAVPDWGTLTAGSKVRVALWLYSEIGPGRSFTKAKMRAAFPGVEQIDRRMRDLRSEGWVIATSREDGQLGVDELRLVSIGEAIWLPGRRPHRGARLSRSRRRAVLAADLYACTSCGITAGETYPDEASTTGKLLVVRTAASGSAKTAAWHTSCERCYAGGQQDEPSLDEVMTAVDALDAGQLQEFTKWVARARRGWRPQDVVWATYQRLSSVQRDAVRAHIGLR
ncbi:MAG: hypothetical protein ACRENX_02835 [Candidatus Dormibacteria bacterium]